MAAPRRTAATTRAPAKPSAAPKAKPAARPALTIVDAINDPHLFAPYFAGPSWDGWRAILKAAHALPMTPEEISFFRTVADRDPPTRPVTELWCIVGRRGGKDSIASVIASHSAALFDQQDRLRPGETAAVLCLACDRDQARIILNYSRAYFSEIPLLSSMVTRETATGFELNNRVEITVATNSFRSVRGRPVLCAIMDEVAFYRDETSASPDEETFKAIQPALASIPGAMVIGISSPYRKAGLLHRKFKQHYGQPGDVLVIRASTRTLNPTIPQEVVDRALEEDPAAARAEWLAEFRDDISGFLDEGSIVDAIDSDRPLELPPREGIRYHAFVDASAGRHDAFCIGIGHVEGDRIVADVVRGRKPPFDPASVAAEYAALAQQYRIGEVVGDNYAGEWVAQAFRTAGVRYRRCEIAKSGLYLEGLPVFMRGGISIPQEPTLIRELRLLERRTTRSGRDSVDHGQAGSDDFANVLFGAMWCCRLPDTPALIWFYERISQEMARGDAPVIEMRAPPGASHVTLSDGKSVLVPSDRIVRVSRTDAAALEAGGWQRLTKEEVACA